MGMSNFAMSCCADQDELQEIAVNTCLGKAHSYYTKDGIYEVDEQYSNQVHGYAIAVLYCSCGSTQ